MSRHRFEVATQKEDIVGSNKKLMLEQKCKLRTSIEVATRNSCHNQDKCKFEPLRQKQSKKGHYSVATHFLGRNQKKKMN